MNTRIRYLRMLAGLTQDELAEQAQVGRSTIISAEGGKIPRISNMRKIANALKVEVRELYTEDPKLADGTFNPRPTNPKRAA